MRAFNSVNYINLDNGFCETAVYHIGSNKAQLFLEDVFSVTPNVYSEILDSDMTIYGYFDRLNIFISFCKRIGGYILPVLTSGSNYEKDRYNSICKRPNANSDNTAIYSFPYEPYIGYRKNPSCIVLPDLVYRNLVLENRIPQKYIINQNNNASIILIGEFADLYYLLKKDKVKPKYSQVSIKKYMHKSSDSRFAFIIKESDYSYVLNENKKYNLEYLYKRGTIHLDEQ